MDVKFKDFGDLSSFKEGEVVNTIRLGDTRDRFLIGRKMKAFDEKTGLNFTIEITRVVKNSPSSILRNHAHLNHSVIANNISKAEAADWLRTRLVRRYHSHYVARTTMATAVYFKIINQEEE